MMYVADTEQLFRLIQSISSPKTEPFKLWLAQVVAEKLDEMQDHELQLTGLWSTISSWAIQKTG